MRLVSICFYSFYNPYAPWCWSIYLQYMYPIFMASFVGNIYYTWSIWVIPHIPQIKNRWINNPAQVEQIPPELHLPGRPSIDQPGDARCHHHIQTTQLSILGNVVVVNILLIMVNINGYYMVNINGYYMVNDG